MDDNAYMAETVDNTLMLEILQELRKDVRDVRTVVLQLAEQNRRLERRFNELKDDLELMVKSELLGALTHFQNKIEIYVEQRLAEKAEQARLRLRTLPHSSARGRLTGTHARPRLSRSNRA